MNRSKRIDEGEVAVATERYLMDAGGTATIKQIRRALPAYLQLSTLDCQQSVTRPGEQLWEQQVRNLVCHRDSEGNPVKVGRLRYSPRCLSLIKGPQPDLFDNDIEEDGG